MDKEKRLEIVRKSIAKHDAEISDRVTIRLPKGTKERILRNHKSVNSYVVHLVLDALAKEDHQIEEPERVPVDEGC